MRAAALILIVLAASCIPEARAQDLGENTVQRHSLHKSSIDGAIRGSTSGASCGDGTKNGTEECDTSDFGTSTCANEGGYGGSLTCTAACAIDTSSCCGAPPTTNLVSWWSAHDIDGDSTWNSAYSNGANVTAWDDKGSINIDLENASGTDVPTLSTSCINGLPCVVYDGINDFSEGNSVSAWNVLHNGNDFTAYTVWKTTNASPENYLCTWITQSSFGSSPRGSVEYFSDNAAQEDLGGFFLSNGASGILSIASADNTLNAGQWHTTVTKVDDDGGGGADGFFYVDGTVRASGATSGAYSAGNASNNFTIGSRGSLGCNQAPMHYAQILIYDAAHSDVTRDTVEDWATCVYGAFPQ